ncbi:MAG: META domain-containing protein [Actinobacteria bacterium]|nr:META domain-containing protein [Actinomycetota bacterium]
MIRRLRRRNLLVAGAAAAGLAAAFALAGCAAAPGPVGTWGSSAEGKPQLVLEANGSLNGTDGCNRLTGSWSEKGGTITFGQVASTRMACVGVDTWLIDLATARVDGSTMHVHNAAGKEIGTLGR